MYRKPSRLQLCRYAVLTCLSEADTLSFNDISQSMDFEDNNIVRTLGALLNAKNIKRIKKEGVKTQYKITNSGKIKQKYFRNKRRFDKLWKAPWEEKNISL